MLNLPANVSNGILLNYIAPAGPADEAGLARGDIIYEMDGITVSGVSDAQAKINSLKVGDRLEMAIYRDGERFKVTLVAVERQ
jgi:S1-C subfamily serine protease